MPLVKVNEALTEALVGKTVEEARKVAEERGLTLRVMEKDGKACIGTCDFRTNRVNVRTSQDTVIGIKGVG